MTDAGSVTNAMRDLARGARRDEATRVLWLRFSEVVASHAARELRHLRAAGRVADEADAASWAFAKVCRGIESGQLVLAGRIDLRRLLLRTAERELQRQIRRERAAKRGGGRAIPWADAEEAGLLRGDAGRDADPAVALAAMDGCRRLLDALDSDDLRAVARWKLIGYTNREVAGRLGVAVPTVEFMLRQIRALWAKEAGGLKAKPGPRGPSGAGGVDAEATEGPGAGVPDDIAVILTLLVGSIVSDL